MVGRVTTAFLSQTAPRFYSSFYGLLYRKLYVRFPLALTTFVTISADSSTTLGLSRLGGRIILS